MLHKTLSNGIKDIDAKQGIICAYASSFGVVDDGGDEVVKGAYLKTIAEQGPQSKQPRIKFLAQHDVTQILGTPHVLQEDGFGLYFEAKIQPTTLGLDYLTLYSNSCVTEHSIGYEVVQAEWDRARGVRLLKELKLYEISACTFGMNPITPVVAIKSLTQRDYITTLADRAAKLDHVLHHGTLRSDTLCQSLERELKSLHAALAPADEAPQPYTIKGVLDSMNDLATRLQAKAASDEDKKAQEARSKKYGIGIKDGGHVTKPSKYASLSDDDFADPTNYSYPLDTKAHADNAASRFGDPDNRAVYTKDEQAIIDKRIAAAQKKFGEDKEDDSKGAAMTRLIKSKDGDIEVSDDGTHGAFTGTHTHAHKAMGDQGDDDLHEHEHTHDGDGDHGHSHAKAQGKPHSHKQPPQRQMQKAPNGRAIRKARDFGTLFAALNESDQLQDDWGDTFIAFVQCMEELMWQSYSQVNGWMPEGSPTVDIEAAAKENLDAFSTAVMSLVTRSVAADFVPQMTCDGDQFIDPDGPNAESDMDDDDYYKSHRQPKAMPAAPAPLRKAGRSISEGNRKTITDALDGMSEAMKAMKAHHGAIADLMTKTDPDHTRQDEDDTQGDDDAENGGTNPNKSRNHPAPERHSAATTQGFDLSFMDTTLDALRRRH